MLVTKDNQLYLESSYAFGCIRDGAKFTKSGRGSIQSKVSSTLQVLDDIILVDRFLPENIAELVNEKDMPVYLDVRSVRNPATRARNVRYRVTASPGWKTTFQIIWDKTVVSRNEMEGVLRDAGQFWGLGGGRNIGYGRFIVNDFFYVYEHSRQSLFDSSQVVLQHHLLV